MGAETFIVSTNILSLTGQEQSFYKVLRLFCLENEVEMRFVEERQGNKQQGNTDDKCTATYEFPPCIDGMRFDHQNTLATTPN